MRFRNGEAEHPWLETGPAAGSICGPIAYLSGELGQVALSQFTHYETKVVLVFVL